MTDYDTTTLNGSLLQLGDTMASNLNEKGITDASVEDGLTTLAGRILDISGEKVFKLEASETLSDVGDSVTFTATISPYVAGKTVKLYSGSTFIAHMVDMHNGKYEYTLTLDEAGVYSFQAKEDTEYTSPISVTVRDETTLEITSVTGLRPHITSFIEYVYDGDEFTVEGSLKDSTNNPLANQTLQLSLGDVNVGTTTTDSNGLFTATVITPYFDVGVDTTEFTLKVTYDGTEVYGEAEDTAGINYQIISTQSPNSLNYLQAVVDAAKDNNIHLTHDYEYTSEDPTSGVTINKILTINGHDYSIDGKESCRLFNNTANTVINDLNISNCRQANTGGAIIQSTGTLEINNCNFNNCQAVNSGGTTYYDGGAIHTSNDLTIRRSKFTNVKGLSGGALYVSGGSANCVIVDSNFVNCTSTDTGGWGHGGSAIMYTPSSLLNISGSNFINCTSSLAAIQVTSVGGANVSISNSYFDNCVCTSGGGSGGINIRSPLNIDKTSFINCEGGNGGVIKTHDKTTITGSSFINNTGSVGGVFFFDNGSGGSVVDGCLFLNNYATGGYGGGVAFCRNLAVTVRNSIILNNSAAYSDNRYKIFTTDFGSSGTFYTLNYNWWGHNSSNKSSLTPVIPAQPGYSTLNNWLYVTSSIDDDSINVGEKSKVKYDLNNYATTSTTGLYDASSTPTCDISLTATKGSLNTEKAHFSKGLSNIIEFLAEETGTGTVNLKEDTSTYSTTNITIGKGTSILTVSKPEPDAILKNPVTITGELKDNNGNPLKNKNITITEE